jgi:hypothetical protein
MGIQSKFKGGIPDGMPLPKKRYLVPFDEATWNELMKAMSHVSRFFDL